MWCIYVWRDKAFIPSTVKAKSGFYVDVEPVFTADVSDLSSLAAAISNALLRGCPRVPDPPMAPVSSWVVLKAAGVPSISRFEKDATCWSIQKLGERYQFGPVQKIIPRGWQSEPDDPFFMPATAGIPELAHEIAKQIQLGGV